MRVRGVTAYYVTEDYDVRYLSGKDTGRVLVTNQDAILWVRGVYAELYDRTYSLRGYPLEVRVYEKGDLKKTLRSLRSKTVGVSSSEYVGRLRRLSRKRVRVSDAVEYARSVKARQEVKMIKRSCGIAKAGVRKARETVSEGVRELDAVAEIEAEMRRRGSETAPFGSGMLLASGKRSADIHAKPTKHRIGRGPVVVDLGAVYGGYHSDTTRTLMVGPPTREEKKVLGLVENVRDETIDMITPGMLASSVHGFVDGRLKAAGYRLHHLAGHGVGLEIHESPGFSPGSRVKLKENMVFTVEPGVYLPHKFGARFEDTVLLTKKGCRKIT